MPEAHRKVSVVTGASSGVGRATAVELGRRGHSVGLIARGSEGLEATAAEVAAAGGRGMPIVADVADFDQVDAAAERSEAELGPIDVWVNNAMTTVFAPFKEIEPDEFRRVTEVTYLGVVWGTQAALRRMLPRDAGAIVQVGSALGYRGIPLQSAYCGAKHAIKGFFESVRSELLHDASGVRMSMVQLPALNTPQFDHCRTRLPRRPQPVPPIYQPEIAAEAIAWAAETGEREVYVGAPTFKAVWGNKLASGLGDAYLARTGYDSQQTDEPLPEGRPDNLFEPVQGDHGTRGRFDHRSRPSSPLPWLSKPRRAAVKVAGALSAALASSGRR